MECPVCSCLIYGDIDRHVNDHLDQVELEKDEQFAKAVASGAASPKNVNEYYDFGLIESNHAWCTYGCDEAIPLSDWDSHCLGHELECKELEAASSSSSQRSPWDIQTLSNTQTRDSFFLVHEGLINLIRKCMVLEHQVPCAYAVTSHIDHYQSTSKQDLGWGCGWRNIQMLSSYLLQKDDGYRMALFGGSGFVPTIPALQQWLELAWSRGYDPDGAQHFNTSIYGSHKWIGTTECAALLRSFGVRAQIVDFKCVTRGGHPGTPAGSKRGPRKSVVKKYEDISKGKPALHWEAQCDSCGVFPIRGTRFRSRSRADFDLCFKCVENQPGLALEFERIEKPVSRGGEGEDVNHQRLVDWVWNYYTEEEEQANSNANKRQQPSITISRRPPLYFQHQGHSRTIIGIQRRRRSQSGPEEAFLLILDPSQRTEELAKALRAGTGWQKMIKRGVYTLRKPEYQLCYVEPGIAQGKELEEMKDLTSISFMY